jgi:hypothetical protein
MGFFSKLFGGSVTQRMLQHDRVDSPFLFDSMSEYFRQTSSLREMGAERKCQRMDHGLGEVVVCEWVLPSGKTFYVGHRMGTPEDLAQDLKDILGRQ